MFMALQYGESVSLCILERFGVSLDQLDVAETKNFFNCSGKQNKVIYLSHVSQSLTASLKNNAFSTKNCCITGIDNKWASRIPHLYCHIWDCDSFCFQIFVVVR